MKLPCLFCGEMVDGLNELLAHGASCPAMLDKQKGSKKSTSAGVDPMPRDMYNLPTTFFGEPIDELLKDEMKQNMRRQIEDDLAGALAFGTFTRPTKREAVVKRERTVEDLGPYIREVCDGLVDKLEQKGSITIPRQMDTARDLILVLKHRGVKFNVDENANNTLTFHFVNGC